MRHVLFPAALAALLLLVARSTAADEASDAKAILDRGIKALGGQDRLEKLKAATWKAKGTFHGDAGTLAFTSEGAAQAPDRYRAAIRGEVNGMTYKMVRVINGDKGWTKIGDGAVKEMNSEALAEARRELEVLAAARLLPLREASYTLKATGATKVGDKPAVGLEATAKDGRKFHLDFDKTSGLLLRLEAPVPAHGGGPEVRQEILFDEYKEFGGIKHAGKEILKRDGRTVLEQEFTDYTPAEKLDAKEFDRPS
jgi:hypothetical protein